MAIQDGNGGVILKVDADTSEIEKSLLDVSKLLEQGDTKTAQLANNFIKAGNAVDTQRSKVEALRTSLDQLNQAAQISAAYTATTSAIEQEVHALDELDVKAREVAASQEAAINKGDTAAAEELGQQYEVLAGKADELGEALRRDDAHAEELRIALENAGGAPTQASIDTVTAKLAQAENKLSTLSNQADIAGAKLEQSMTQGAQGSAQLATGISLADTHMGKFITRVERLAKRVFIFSVITMAFRHLRTMISGSFKDSEQFRHSVDMLKASLWTLIEPIKQAVLPALNALMQGLAKVNLYIASFIGALQGKSIKDLTKSAKATYENAQAIGSAAKNTKKLAKETKDANKQFADFDDIITLSGKDLNDMSDDAGAGAGVDNIGAAFDELADNTDLTIFDTLGRKLKEISDIFMSGFWKGFGDTDFSKPFNSLKDISSKIKEIADENLPKMQSLSNSATYALGQAVGAAVSIGTTVATNFTGGVEQYLEENGDTVSERIGNILEAHKETVTAAGNLWTNFADTFSVFADENGITLTSNIIGIFADAGLGIVELGARIGADFIKGLAQVIEDNKELIKTALDGILGFFASLTGDIKKLVDELVDGILELYKEHISPLIDSLMASLSQFVTTFLEGWNTYIQPVLDKIAEKFHEVVEEHLSPMIDKGVEYFGKLIDAIKDLWDNVLSPRVDWIIEHMMPVFATVFEFLGDELTVVLQVIGDVVGSVFDILGGLIDFLVGVFTGDWEKAWNGLFDILKGIVNLIIGLFEGIVNALVGALNALISGANMIVGAVGDLFGQSWSIPKVPELHLPRLATGGIVPHATALVAGEAGREAILPLENNTEWMDELADRIAARNGTSGQSTVILEVDGREFGRAVVEQGNKENRRVGTRLVLA